MYHYVPFPLLSLLLTLSFFCSLFCFFSPERDTQIDAEIELIGKAVDELGNFISSCIPSQPFFSIELNDGNFVIFS